MRSIIAILLVLAGVGIVSCRLDGLSANSPAPSEIDWVRTADGWERPGSWLPTMTAAPRLHPLVVAGGQVLASVTALMAFGSQMPRRR